MPAGGSHLTMTDPPAVDDHGHHEHDGHGADASTLGPIDLAAWGAGALGVAIAIAMAACFALATNAIG